MQLFIKSVVIVGVVGLVGTYFLAADLYYYVPVNKIGPWSLMLGKLKFEHAWPDITYQIIYYSPPALLITAICILKLYAIGKPHQDMPPGSEQKNSERVALQRLRKFRLPED